MQGSPSKVGDSEPAPPVEPLPSGGTQSHTGQVSPAGQVGQVQVGSGESSQSHSVVGTQSGSPSGQSVPLQVQVPQPVPSPQLAPPGQSSTAAHAQRPSVSAAQDSASSCARHGSIS